MPLAGGSADKLGNRYELWWTVLKAMDILWGQWDAIRFEQPGVEKAEFVLRDGIDKSLHQAKRQGPEGKWTLADLSSKDNPYLQTIGTQLQNTDTSIVFVSGSDAPELMELSARARDSVSTDEFEQHFVQAKKHQAGLRLLQRVWGGCDVNTAREYLRRIEVRVLDERSLRDQALMTAQALFLRAPYDACLAIVGMVLDSVHRGLSRKELTEALARQGFHLRQVTNVQQARPRIDEVTRKYLDNGRGRLIQGKLIPRDFTKQLHAHMEGPKTDCVVTGRAGTGKSGCVAEFVQELRERNVPVLAFRLDRVDPVKSTAELGQALGLEESPALLLGAAAEGHEKAALVIDQLDSISTTSGRTTGFFDAVEAMMNEVRGLQSKAEIHVFVVCREFDWKNDHRLRKLLNKEHSHIPIGDFSEDQVRAILKRAGVEPDSLTPHQLALLCLPQNLSLFLEADFTVETPFNTTLDLFDRYWTNKRLAVAERSQPEVDQWNEVIQTLVDGMTTSQQLSVRREALDKCSPRYAEQMISEGVITRDGHRIGFGHESFFDYCFARQFVQQPRTLTEFLLEGEQHLFRRAQVRQVLQYLHESEPGRFCSELRGLISHPKIRTHVKDLALAVAANLNSISAQDWEMWVTLIAPSLESARSKISAGLEADLAWKHFFSSVPLFQKAFETGWVYHGLESSEEGVVNLVFSYLRFHESRYSKEAASLLAPFKNKSEAWNQRLVWFMQLVNLNGSREMFDLFLELLADGTLDEARGAIAANSTFWNLAYDVSEKNPARVCEIIATWLVRQLEIVKKTDTGEHIVSLRHDNFAERPIGRSAEREPLLFIQNILPVVLSIATWAKIDEAETPRKDRVWRYLIAQDNGRPHDQILSRLQDALKAIAIQSPTLLSSYVDTLKASDLYVANMLLLSIYAGNGPFYANDAADTLAEQPWRFESGLSGNSHWFAQRAIAAVFEHADDDRQERLEAAVTNYVPSFEKESFGYKYRGHAKFNLLAMIPVSRRSAKAKGMFQELERKFKTPQCEPEGARGGWVGSPIPDDGLSKMDDDATLAAIDHFSTSTRPRNPHDFLRGGSLELARAIANLAQKDPSRFAAIALRLPTKTHPDFFAELLRTFKEAPLEDFIKLELCAKAFGEYRDTCGREIADLLGSVKSGLPDKSLEQLQWLALESPEPPFGVDDVVPEGQRDPLADPFNRGLNLTRGRAVLAIGNLIQTDAAYISRFDLTLEKLTVDKSTAVQACSAFVWRVIAISDYQYAYEMFTKSRTVVPSLPRTHYGYDLVHAGLRDYFTLVRPLVEEMMASTESEDVKAASQLACIAALRHPEAHEIAIKAVTGDEEQRHAAARVAATNVGVGEFRLWCEKQLYIFFDDPDETVRRTAADCFRAIGDQPLDAFSELIESFCRSQAYETNSFALINALDESVELLPGIVCMACEQFLRRFGSEARDIRTSRAADGYRIPKLAFRVYHQHQRDEWASRALDLIDQLCEQGVGETFNELREFDR